MEYRKAQLNTNAAIVRFDKSKVSKSLEQFFTLLFTSWNENNVDSIISSIEAESIEEMKKIYNELFINIYKMASLSQTSIKAENVIVAINTLDTLMPEVLIGKSKCPESVIEEYNAAKEAGYHHCFDKIRMACILFSDTSSGIMLLEIKNVLLVLSKLSHMAYFEKFVYDFASFLWQLFLKHRKNVDLCENFLFAMSNISEKLFTFLLLYIDKADTTKPFRELALQIFVDLKSELIEKKLDTREIAYVLNILDQHDRLIGKYLDAVPENMFFDGYIICDSQTKCFENDDVYEDYEKFLAMN